MECWGRNGFFKYKNYEVFGQKERVYVTLNSKHAGKNSPIMVIGKIEEVIDLFESIMGELREVS